MPLSFFKKKDKEVSELKPEDIKIPMTLTEEMKEPKDLEKTEIEDLSKLGVKEDFPLTDAGLPEIESDLAIKETIPIEPEEISREVEEPTIAEPTTERIIEIDESGLKELNVKIDEELSNIKQKLKDIGKLTGLTLDSPEMIDLLDLYMLAKDNLQKFIDEINKLDLTGATEKRTFAAIYKFKACKTLSEIKKEIRKIESISRNAGFIPSKVHEILESKAEDLINSFIKDRKKEKIDSTAKKSK